MKVPGMSGFGILATLVLAALFGAPSPAQQTATGAKVTVHLVDARSGRPIARKTIRMRLFGHNNRWLGKLDVKTGDDGVAVFHLSNPLPEFVDVRPTTGGWWDCGSTDEPGIKLSEILTSGVSKEDLCLRGLHAIDTDFHPKPGELYTFWVRQTILERWKYCGHWGCREYPPIRSSSTSAPTPAAGPPHGGRPLASQPSRHKILIRVVNGKNGRPIARKNLLVYTALARPSARTGAPYKQTGLETDDNGEAIFAIDDPKLKLLVFLAVKGSSPCSAEQVDPEQVLREGLVTADKCDPAGRVRAKFTATPGELVVFYRLPRF